MDPDKQAEKQNWCFKDMEKKVKKLETQVKLKTNEADLEALRIEMHSELEEKASLEALKELEQTRPTEETIRQMIKEEIQSNGTAAEVATAQGPTERKREIEEEK